MTHCSSLKGQKHQFCTAAETHEELQSSFDSLFGTLSYRSYIHRRWKSRVHWRRFTHQLGQTTATCNCSKGHSTISTGSVSVQCHFLFSIQAPFNLEEVPFIQEYLLQRQPLSEDECYKQSLLREVRTPGTPSEITILHALELNMLPRKGANKEKI